MNYLFRRLLLACLVMSGCNHFANAADVVAGMSRADLKALMREVITESFAFVNPIEAIEQLDEFKDEVKRVEREYESRLAQARSLQEAGMKKQQELQKMGNALSDSAKDRKQEELIQLESQYRIKIQSAQEFAQRVQQEIQMRMLKLIQDEAEVLSKEKNYILVIGGGVIYGAKPIDITSQVVERLNKKYAAKKKKQVESKPADKK